jgi:hypothetical protein
VCPSLARIADRRACLRSPNPLAEWRTWKRCLARRARPPTRKGARLDPGHAPAPGRLVRAGGARWWASLGLVRRVGAPRNRVGSARPQTRSAIGGDPRALQQRPGRLVVAPGRRPGPRLRGGLQLVMAHHEEEDSPGVQSPWMHVAALVSETLITQRYLFLYRSARAVSMSVERRARAVAPPPPNNKRSIINVSIRLVAAHRGR